MLAGGSDDEAAYAFGMGRSASEPEARTKDIRVMAPSRLALYNIDGNKAVCTHQPGWMNGAPWPKSDPHRICG